MLETEDLLKIKGELELEIKGFVKVEALYPAHHYKSLLRNNYIEEIEMQPIYLNAKKFRITNKGKPYLKLYDESIWVKPHAINLISELIAGK